MTKPSLTLMATRNLTRNRFRSVLACAGIAIGVFAIASLGIFGNVLSVEASQSIGEIGSEVIVTPNEEEGFSSLAERDVEEIERVTSGVPSTAIITEGGLAVSGGETTTATYYGTNSPDSIFEAEEGNIEAYRSGALVGAGVAGVPLRFVSLMVVAYGSVAVLAVALTAPTTFLRDGEILADPTPVALATKTLKAVSVGAIFSVVGAATADSVF